MNTVALLDLAKQRQGITSDYRLAQLLHCNQCTVTGYRHGRSRPTNVIAARLAALCDLDFGHVLLYLAIERADEPEVRATWARVAADFAASEPPPSWADPRHFGAVDKPAPVPAKP